VIVASGIASLSVAFVTIPERDPRCGISAKLSLAVAFGETAMSATVWVSKSGASAVAL